MTLAVGVFLVAHGLLHLAIWLPKPAPGDREPAPPFEPDRSAVLTRVLAEPRVHSVAIVLAWTSAVAFVLAGLAVLLGLPAAPIATAAAVSGLVLKGLYFNPWLTVGVLLDLAVLTSALTGWPVAL